MNENKQKEAGFGPFFKKKEYLAGLQLAISVTIAHYKLSFNLCSKGSKE